MAALGYESEWDDEEEEIEKGLVRGGRKVDKSGQGGGIEITSFFPRATPSPKKRNGSSSSSSTNPFRSQGSSSSSSSSSTNQFRSQGRQQSSSNSGSPPAKNAKKKADRVASVRKDQPRTMPKPKVGTKHLKSKKCVSQNKIRAWYSKNASLKAGGFSLRVS